MTGVQTCALPIYLEDVRKDEECADTVGVFLKVVGVQDYEKGRHVDVEGQELPKERMLIFDLGDGFRVAVRASGTEPNRDEL